MSFDSIQLINLCTFSLHHHHQGVLLDADHSRVTVAAIRRQTIKDLKLPDLEQVADEVSRLIHIAISQMQPKLKRHSLQQHSARLAQPKLTGLTTSHLDRLLNPSFEHLRKLWLL